MVYRAFGDSVTQGYSASAPAYAWVNVLSAAIGQPITNYGHAGDMVPDQAVQIYSVPPAAGDVAFLTLGINDQRIYGSDVTKRGYYKRGLLAEAAWLAAGARTLGTASTSETGTWENTYVYGIGRCGRTAGSTKSFQVTGTSVYVAYIAQSSQPGAFDVIIDGVTAGSFGTSASPALTTYNGLTYGPQLARFNGLSGPGPHTVEIDVTAGDRVYIDWVAGNDQVVKPRVFVETILRSSNYQYGGSDANVDAYNAEIANVVAMLQADGMDVTLVDLHAALNTTTDLSSDGLHPNDLGHSKIAAAYQSALLGAAPVTYTPVTVYLGSDGKYYVGTDAVKREIVIV